MPIYEYQCAQCQHRLEALQKMSDEPLRQCPECEQPGLTKLVSAASFRLKGGGWYETDFKTGNKKQLADSGAEKSATSSDSKASDTSGNSGNSDKSGNSANSGSSGTKVADKTEKTATVKKESKSEKTAK